LHEVLMAVGSMPASALAEAGAEGAAGEGAAAWVLRAARVLGAGLAEAAARDECAWCRARELRGAARPFARCARCREVKYCCVAHQRADWRAHKPFCIPPGAPEPPRARAPPESEERQQLPGPVSVVDAQQRLEGLCRDVLDSLHRESRNAPAVLDAEAEALPAARAAAERAAAPSAEGARAGAPGKLGAPAGGRGEAPAHADLEELD
jgi:hypothetical protein